jgi:2-C-methyl-D-erythritol 4-phosphate cytidylyltransferase
MIDAGIVACRRRGPLAFGRRVADTVKRVRLGRVVETIDRRDLVAIETPQFFPLSLLRRAHAGGADATDDCALVERLGIAPGWRETPGPNLKVTTRADLAIAGALL